MRLLDKIDEPEPTIVTYNCIIPYKPQLPYNWLINFAKWTSVDVTILREDKEKTPMAFFL